MTAVAEVPSRADDRPDPVAPNRARESDPSVGSTADPPPVAVRRPGVLVAVWFAITVIGVGIVLGNVGPLTEARDQRSLLGDYRDEIVSASNQAFGLAGVETPTKAPSRGAPVAILDVEGIGLRRVVVEGTAPRETRTGPGHVVGTGGPGQPGNSVVVGRRALFGGAFGAIDDVEVGDRILVSTTQGQTVYVVSHVGTHEIVAEDDDAAAPAEEVASPSTTVPVVDVPEAADEVPEQEESAGDAVDGDAPVLPDGPVTVDELYGPSADDRLTLVTSASGAPWASGEAVVVVATMDGVPFPPTPQGGRTTEDDGRSGDPASWAALTLALAAYVAAVAGAVWMHRTLPWRSAYLLSAPLVLALTIVVAEQLAHVLPAWA